MRPAAAVVREAVSRAAVEAADVGHAVFGNVIHTETRDMYLGRVAAVNGGLPVTTSAFTMNRLCGSGLQEFRVGPAAACGEPSYRTGGQWAG